MTTSHEQNGSAAASECGSNPSGTTTPVWYEGHGRLTRGRLARAAQADICIVGAGIAGITAAYLLARAGKSVIVIDEKPVGGGESGRTSAHLASAIDDRFAHIERVHGLAAARTAYQSHAAAIDFIEAVVAEESIDCDFARIDGLLFAGDDKPDDSLDEEFEAARRAGVAGVERLARPPAAGVLARPCLRFPRQARFHPLKYLVGLAAAAEGLGVTIHCGTRVMDLSGDGPVRATTRSGHIVTAEAGIAATNVPTPINNWAGIYLKSASYRTYVVGLEIAAGSVGDALYWDMLDPYHYVRLGRFGGRSVLLVGGEDHKTGQHGDGAAPTDRFERLAAWAREWFPSAGGVVARWSGQVCEPDDGLGLIGRVPSREHAACYVISGDSGMGLTHGTLGAMLVSDLILGRPSPWEQVYDPERTPLRAPGAFVRENANAAAQLADYLTPGEVSSEDEVARGTGAIVREGLHKLAVYRDRDGRLHRCSAVCPHLKCIVRWNAVEESWDCPCHGSRFDARGRLIMGPSTNDLRPT